MDVSFKPTNVWYPTQYKREHLLRRRVQYSLTIVLPMVMDFYLPDQVMKFPDMLTSEIMRQ